MTGRFASLTRCTFEHGTRACYVRGCRCAACREANTLYARRREAQRLEQLAELAVDSRDAQAMLGPAAAVAAPQVWTAPDGSKQVRFYARACPGVDGQPCPTSSHLRKDSKGGRCTGCRNRLTTRGLVPADKARAHLLGLSKTGVGRRAVVAASDVGDTTLALIRNGTSRFISSETERRILSVDQGARADGALVAAGETTKALRELRRLGWAKSAIAAALGSEAKAPSLQLSSGQVVFRNAHAVTKLLERAKAAHQARKLAKKEAKRRATAEAKQKRGLCPRCRLSHRDDPVAWAWCQANLEVPLEHQEAA